MKIKWIRLLKVVKEMVAQEVTITLSTSDQLKGLMSAVRFTKDNADIILSSSCKSVTQVLKATAHEVAHIIQNNDKHDEKFYTLWEETEEKIVKKYNK